MVKIRLFDTQNKSQMKELDSIIAAQVEPKEKKNELQSRLNEMVEWLKIYVNNPDFIAGYTDRHCLELVAEATFWSVKLGLSLHFAVMNYQEILDFEPLKEGACQNTARAKAINRTCSQLRKPAFSHEASYALRQAANCVYLHHNSLENKNEEENEYQSKISCKAKL